METAGQAYCFFYCNAEKDAVAEEIQICREMIGTPSELELILANDAASIERLISTIESKMPDADIKRGLYNYALIATSPNQSNEETAQELGAILDKVYMSHLYKEGDDFYGRIFCDWTKGSD